jgi:hypothetical protein
MAERGDPSRRRSAPRVSARGRPAKCVPILRRHARRVTPHASAGASRGQQQQRQIAHTPAKAEAINVCGERLESTSDEPGTDGSPAGSPWTDAEGDKRSRRLLSADRERRIELEWPDDSLRALASYKCLDSDLACVSASFNAAEHLGPAMVYWRSPVSDLPAWRQPCISLSLRSKFGRRAPLARIWPRIPCGQTFLF